MPGILATTDNKETVGNHSVSGECVKPVTGEGHEDVKESLKTSNGESVRVSSPGAESDHSLSTNSTSEPESDQKSPQDVSNKDTPSEVSEKVEATKKEKSSDVYNIHLIMPGVANPVDITLTSRDTVHDLLQLPLERPECCYRSCLSVRHKGKRLDEFFEIGSLEDFHDGDTVELVEEPYTQRDVRMHLLRLKDLLSTDALRQSLVPSVEGLSLSFLAAIALTNPEGAAARVGDDLTDLTKLEPPAYILPSRPHSSTPPPVEDTPTPTLDTEHKTGVIDGPSLNHYYPPNLDKHFKLPECLKSLCYSPWNPPTNKRKMKGDLLYLEVVTLEGVEHYITACPSGFYLNKSTSRENFDPTSKKTHHLNKHLNGLLSQISPLFKKNFASLRKFCDAHHPFEILPVPYPVLPWVAPRPEHKPVTIRIDDSMGLKPVPDELVLGQFRDWNEELQTAKELPGDSIGAKIFKERSLFKIHSDFVQASVRGAMAAVDGNLPTLNPGDELKFRMYMWNNIFFSFAFDGRDHYKEFGGDAGAHAAAAADLHGVAAHERCNKKGLYTLATVIVDYRGYRVVCQSVIPGLLQREHDAAVVYGSIDTGKNIKTDQEFVTMLSKVADEFHIRPHKLYADEKREKLVELPSSFEVKGIVGNDRRHYALDLFRTFPPDANYMEVSEGSKVRHRMAVLRPELIDTYHNYKFLHFLRLVRNKTSKIGVVQRLQKENEAKLAAAAGLEVAKKADSSSNSSKAAKEESLTNGSEQSEGTKKETEDSNTSKKEIEDSEAAKRESEDSKMDSSVTFTPLSSPANLTNQSPATVSPNNLSPQSMLRTSSRANAPTIPLVGLSGAIGQEVGNGTEPNTAGPPAEGNPLPSDELYLLTVEGLEEEKEVGPELPPAPEDLQGLPTQAETLGKELEDLPEVAAAVKEALMEAGSTSLDGFQLNYNVDILSPVVKHADSEEVLEKDRTLVREASKFLVDSLIPQFVRDCIQLSVTPLDGDALKQAMHSRGINVRYLGEIAKLAARREDLQHLQRLCVSEMIVRTAKGRLRVCLQESPLEVISEAIVHFLNCFLGDTQVVTDPSEETPLVNGHARKKNKKRKLPNSHKVAPHSKMSSQSLWEEIMDEVGWYYRYKLEFSSLAETCSNIGLQKTAVMRELCRKTGIQLVLREYNFSVQPVFTEDDIASTYPVVKHTDYRSLEAVALFEVAQSKMNSGNLLLAQELFAEAIHMSIQIYGPMHVDIANCYRQAAKVSQLLGEPVNALSNQHKATLIFERVLGVDHPDTLAAYISLALYCHNTKQTAAALRLLYRARYLLLLVYGEDHPEMATCDSNIAVVLLSVKDYSNALLFFESTLRLYKKYYGSESLQTALTHHLLARVHSFLGDFRAALHHEKLTYSIYSKKFGSESERTQESYSCLKDLTGKAVTMQKTINEMMSKGSASKMLELPGSWGEVVGMLSGQEQRQSKKPHIVRKRKRAKQAQAPPTD